MMQALPKRQFDIGRPDDELSETIFSSKQKRLLIEPLYSSWTLPQDEENESSPILPRPFMAEADVGVFYSINRPPLVPDVFLSLDVQVGEDSFTDKYSPYFIWETGKVPEVIIKFVTNEDGNDLRSILRMYERLPITYSIVFDPLRRISDIALRVYEIAPVKQYQLREDFELPTLGLSLTLWEGEYEGVHDTWLRWCDQDGELIPTGREGRERESVRADSAEAEVARLRAELATLTSRRRQKK